MNYIKLQIGCLTVILYIVLIYVKETMHGEIKCNPLYDAMFFICPWAVVFDGVTAWTVNHLEIVPSWLNLTTHAMFFVLMALSMIITFIYTLDLTTGIYRNKKAMVLATVPGIITIVLIFIFLPQLYYVEGRITNYSMGISVIVCYVSLIIHFSICLIILIVKRCALEKRKLVSTLTFVSFCFIVLLIQSIFPEVLITSLMPLFLIVGLYINIEDPYLRRIEKYNEKMVINFATLVETRDNSTGGHIKRTKEYVKIILEEMEASRQYNNILTKDYIKNVQNAAPMHDLGKIGVPDYILQKPAKLTDEEFAQMKIHAPRGGDIVRETFSNLDEPEFEKIAYEVARYHHEKWNGKGYPDGLTGKQIPIHARIMAIADVFDAVSAKRCYRDALPLETCFKIIEEGAGVDFDPNLVQLFLEAREKVEEVYHKFKDS